MTSLKVPGFPFFELLVCFSVKWLPGTVWLARPPWMIHQGAGLWDHLASCPSDLMSVLEQLKWNFWKAVKGWVLNFWFALWETLKAKWLIWLSVVCHKTKLSDTLSYRHWANLFTLFVTVSALLFKTKGVDLIISTFESYTNEIFELSWAKAALGGGQAGLCR